MKRIDTEKAVVASAVVLSVLVILLSLGAWFDVFERPKRIPGPAEDIPTPRAVVMASPTPSFWEQQDWLDARGVQSLRVTENVINLASLEGGFASYSADWSAILDESWHEVSQEFGVSAVGVNGTTVIVEGFGFRYSLNTYQPFFFISRPEVLYLVDTTGVLWKTAFVPSVLKDIVSAQDQLVVKIGVNPHLPSTRSSSK